MHPVTAITAILKRANIAKGCSGSLFLYPFIKQKYAPFTVAGERGAKNGFVFTAARSLQSRSYAAGEARYLQADLMLLTHAGCAFKDPRGRFGISNSHPAAVREQARDKLMKSERCATAKRSGLYAVFPPFVPMFSQFRTAALRSNRQCGAAALRTKGPLQTHPQPFGPENYLYRSTRRVRCS